MTFCSITSGSWTTCASLPCNLRKSTPRLRPGWYWSPQSAKTRMSSGCSRHFAFLAARVHLKMDDEFPEITEALLTVVYPQLVRPLPSMSVVEFQLDPEKGKLTSGLKIERNSPLYSKPVAACPAPFAPAMTRLYGR
jgi:hypothetical protein